MYNKRHWVLTTLQIKKLVPEQVPFKLISEHSTHVELLGYRLVRQSVRELNFIVLTTATPEPLGRF